MQGGCRWTGGARKVNARYRVFGKQFPENNICDFHEANQDSPAQLMEKQFVKLFVGRFRRNNCFSKATEVNSGNCFEKPFVKTIVFQKFRGC